MAHVTIENEEQLDELMTRPGEHLKESLSRVSGDLLVLGVAGKMGPTLARLARRALDAIDSGSRVIGVARFSDPIARKKLESWGIETIAADLLDDQALTDLPHCPNVIYMAARKFGSTGDEPLTWAMNTYLPARVAERFRNARIVALSTGNVYPLTPATGSGPDESHPVGPVGEYAQSCLGRERMFQYFSEKHNIPVAIVRLNYAIDLRYGVLHDIASNVFHGRPVDLHMGHVNVLWQGDANDAILRGLEHCATPPYLLNLTGPEVLSVRTLAEAFGEKLGKAPIFQGEEQPDALLNNAARFVRDFGPPAVSLKTMIDWVSHWVRIGGETLNKPTHFETRDGKF